MVVRRVLSWLVLGLLVPLSARAQPSGAHPRILLDSQTIAAWQAMASVDGSPVDRAITRCDRAIATPGRYTDGGYQGFAWVEALTGCLIAFEATADADYRDAAIVYLEALLNDQQTLGDGDGPGYADGDGIVAQDSGYSMRTYGAFAALGYDWLHDSLSPALRATAHQRFVQWIAFHHQPDTYQRAQPGANYHAGHVAAITWIAIAHADEMNAANAGSGTTLWTYVRDGMWGSVMAEGHEARGPLLGGDWLEGWQYGPLSVASYALAGRSLVQQGVAIPWFEAWNEAVLLRYVHGLSPDDRWFVGGDTSDESPLLDPSTLPLHGVVAARTTPDVVGRARAELERLDLDVIDDFRLFHEALAAAVPGEATPIDRTSLPTNYLAEGSGNFYARTAHAADAIWFVSQCRGSIVDHQHLDAGNLVISRGADALLVDPAPYGSLSTLTSNAPTMEQPHFSSEYRPSQGAFGESWGGDLVPFEESTRFTFARGTPSGVQATRCDYTGQLRFRDEPSAIVSSAVRDVVMLPGDTGATVLVVDRMLTTDDYADDSNPLLLRFHAAERWDAGRIRAASSTGRSQLVARRVAGDASTSRATVAVDDCSGDRGKCRKGRFPSDEWTASVPGPNPFTVHLLDADADGAFEPPAVDAIQGATHVVAVHRETRQFVVVTTDDASRTDSYVAAASPSTHVVLDPPAGDHVVVTATAEGDHCTVILAPGASGFASSPLVFTLDAACVVSDDTSSPPRVDPPPPPAPNSGSGGSGCDCAVGAGGRTWTGASWLLGLSVLVVLRRRRAGGPRCRREVPRTSAREVA